MASKVSIPKGTRDYLPHQMLKRQYIFDIIKYRFIQFGYLPIETPSFEHTSTLLGKYGEEGDKLVFRILNSGEKVKKANIEAFSENNLKSFVNSISEKALRYDLTVPFARFVVQNQNELSFPFKRYQIQPVWRADRPQHGRYQEFFQCDADIVGSDSLIFEIEQIKLFDNILSDLKIPAFKIHISNRKLLAGIAEVFNCVDRFMEMVISIDKIDKIGIEGVQKELEDRNFNQTVVDGIIGLLCIQGSNIYKLNKMTEVLKTSIIGLKGIEELKFIIEYLEKNYHFRNGKIMLDMSLARGLNYYTGAIFEVKAENVHMGSLCGGGRYDDLTFMFGLPNISGVGISFGADRIYDVLEELNLFPQFELGKKKVLLSFFEDSDLVSLLNLQEMIREQNIQCEIYSKVAKIQKQMKYANENGYSHVIFQGKEELEENTIRIKNLETGFQSTMPMENIKNAFSN